MSTSAALSVRARLGRPSLQSLFLVTTARGYSTSETFAPIWSTRRAPAGSINTPIGCDRGFATSIHRLRLNDPRYSDRSPLTADGAKSVPGPVATNFSDPGAVPPPPPAHVLSTSSSSAHAGGSHHARQDPPRPRRSALPWLGAAIVVLGTAHATGLTDYRNLLMMFATVGAPREVKDLDAIRSKLSSMPEVIALDNDADWDGWEAYEGLPTYMKGLNLCAGALSTPHALGSFQRCWRHKRTGEVITIAYLGPQLSGWPHVVHGGLLATLLDESCGRTSMELFTAGVGLTARLDVVYRAPVSTNEVVFIRSKPEIEGMVENFASIHGLSPTGWHVDIIRDAVNREKIHEAKEAAAPGKGVNPRSGAAAVSGTLPAFSPVTAATAEKGTALVQQHPSAKELMVEKRKLWVRSVIIQNGRLCAEGHGLFVVPRKKPTFSAKMPSTF